MEFSYPTSSLFTPDGREVVVFSVEEWAQKQAAGLVTERPAIVEPASEQIAHVAPKARRGKAVIAISPEPDAA